ncbi:MAG: phosphoribosyl-AMP cyclohydrolase [Bacillota bacterium]|nr:phosphoribosyl-AMP cyclohydrolase [Bacillota bacterium]
MGANINNENELRPLKTGELKYDRQGLIPAVIQDERNNEILMVGYMNEEALKRTLKEGRVCFWSRSRQKYWVKGETSGNYFELKSIMADCDADTLLLKVIPLGPGKACHTGRYSCFFNTLAGFKQREERND